MARMAAETVERCGAIDILVNNAGPLRVAGHAALRADPGRGVASGHGRQRPEHVPDLPRGRPADARAGRRADREHLVGHALPRRALPAALRDEQGRDRGAHARAGQGARRRRRARQLRGARLHDERRRARAPRGHRGAAGRLGQRAHDQARPGARGRRRRGRLPVRARARRSSPARRWSSTEASTSIEALAHRAPRRRRRRPAPTASSTSSRTAARSSWELGDEAPRGALLSRRGRARRRDRVAHALRPRRLRAGRHRLPPHPPGPGHPLPALRRDHDRLAGRRAHPGPGRGVVRARARPGAGHDGGRRALGLRTRHAAARGVGRPAHDHATSTPPTRTSPRPSARRSSSSSRCVR